MTTRVYNWNFRFVNWFWNRKGIIAYVYIVATSFGSQFIAPIQKLIYEMYVMSAAQFHTSSKYVKWYRFQTIFLYRNNFPYLQKFVAYFSIAAACCTAASRVIGVFRFQ